MAVKISKELLFARMREDNFPFWTVSDAGNLLHRNNAENNLDKSIEKLNALLTNDIDSDLIEVEICDKTTVKTNPLYERQPNRRNEKSYIVSLGKKTKALDQPKFNFSAMDNEYMQKYYQEQLKCFQLEMKITELQNQIQDLEQELNEVEEVEEETTIAGIPKETINQAILHILGITNNAPQAINGIVTETTAPLEPNKTVSNTEKLQAALKKLKSIDADYIQHIELLAKFAEQNKTQYFAFLPTLKGMTK